MEVRPGQPAARLKQRLRMLADRYTGGKVIHMRQDPVPWAYRVFSRQVGIDPTRTARRWRPSRSQRLKHGGLRARTSWTTRSRSRSPRPACRWWRSTPSGWRASWARLARSGEALGRRRPLSARQLVVADAARPVAIVLGEVGRGRGVTPETERMVLCALGVKGVPRISLEEALWCAAETLYT